AVFCLLCVFFFQAEDGIRDFHVTGVQTCALPIWRSGRTMISSPSVVIPLPQCGWSGGCAVPDMRLWSTTFSRRRPCAPSRHVSRSEERRVGKECRCRWAPEHENKKSTTCKEIGQE